MKKSFYQIMGVICVCGFIGAAVFVSFYAYRYFAQKEIDNHVAALYKEATSKTIEEKEPEKTSAIETGTAKDIVPDLVSTVPVLDENDKEQERLLAAEKEGRIRFADLLAINADFIGMIVIDGLGIELPFVQAGDNRQYLQTDFQGAKSDYGTVFLSYDNSRLLIDKNSVLYGHHMRNGTMFAPLLQYKSVDTLKKAPVIVLDSLTGQSTWLIFAAYVCESDFGYIHTHPSESEYDDLLAEMQARSFFHTNIDVCSDDQILTLSTCTYEFQNARFAVHARKLRDAEEIPEITVEKNTNQQPYNVPNSQKLSEIKASEVTALWHPARARTYFYHAIDGGIVYYAGNSVSAQGAYNCFTGEIKSNSPLSVAYVANNHTILAAEGLNGNKGIYLLESNAPDGIFTLLGNKAVTPTGVKATFPLLAFNGNEKYLLYTVAGEQEEIYLLPIQLDGTAGQPVRILSAKKGSGLRAAGFIWHHNNVLFVWHEAANKRLNATWLTNLSAVEELNSSEGILLPSSSAADHITLYPSNGKIRMLSEKNEQILLSTFHIDSVVPQNTASHEPEDATETQPDTAGQPEDANEPQPDTTEQPEDTAELQPDAAEQPEDATAPQPDAAEQPEDANEHQPDAAEQPEDTNEPQPDTTEQPKDTTESPDSPNENGAEQTTT